MRAPFLALALLCATPAWATNTSEDGRFEVLLYDGTRHEGTIEFKSRHLEVRTPRRRRVDYADIAQVRGLPPERPLQLRPDRPAPTATSTSGEDPQAALDALYAEYDARAEAAEGDAEAWVALGEWAQAQGLEGESYGAFEAALDLDPDHEAAHRGLGEVRHDGEWIPFGDLLREQQAQYTDMDADDFVELAEFAEEHGAERQAFDLLRQALSRDTFHSDALEAMRPYTDRYVHVTPLEFPLRGLWQASPDRTRHHSLKGYAVYALDLSKVDDRGRIHRGDGRDLEDYYTWGEPFYAVAPGRVVEVRNDEVDNPVGQIGDRAGKHNGITVDHGNGEFSFYIHAKQGSIVVQEGDVVEAGQLLGEVGNSGGSSLPHLHYTLVTYSALSVPWRCTQFTVIAPDSTPIRFVDATPRESWTIQGP